MPYKRKYSAISSGRKTSFNRRYKRGSTYQSGKTAWSKRQAFQTAGRMLAARVNTLYRTIETKESEFSVANQQIAHNNVYIWTRSPFSTVNGTADPMQGVGQRIGDQVTLRGLAATWFVEGSLQRSKVHFRIMLLKGPRGASFNRDDIFKGMTGNKLIDQINTEKYTVVAQKRFNVSPPNHAPSSLTVLTGVPVSEVPGVTGNKIVKFWIPGRKFGRDGVLRYENSSGTDLKFFDYRWVLFAYDWYGTPQDTNNVGFINEGWSKMYFKDA